MFYKGEFVRSCIHGFAEVVLGGDAPTIRVIAGVELVVPGDTLTVVPDDVYYGAVENRNFIERWLDLRLHGEAGPDLPSLPRPKVDLAAAMQREGQAGPLPDPKPPEQGVLTFISEDLYADSDHPGEGHDHTEAQRVQVTVTRLSEAGSGGCGPGGLTTTQLEPGQRSSWGASAGQRWLRPG